MALNLQIYSNGNAKSKTVTVDFAAGILADSETGVSDAVQYYFKITSSAKNTENQGYGVEIVKGLDELAVDGVTRSASNSAVSYADIRSMIVDYVYDHIHGHEADHNGVSGVIKKFPMDFSR